MPILQKSAARGQRQGQIARGMWCCTFSEALEPAFSGALLMDQDGRNFSGGPVKIDGPLMTLTPGNLAPGIYKVSWHSVGHDTHRMDGDFSFTVMP